MAKSSGEIEKDFIDSLRETTSKDLNAWLKEIKASGIEKRNDIIQWLKNDKKFGHMNASLLAGIYFNNGKAVYDNEASLLENQFLKCPEMKPLFNYLSQQVKKLFPGSQMIAKKTYISFTAKKEFAALNIKPSEIRLGLDLGDMPFGNELEKSKLTGPMPRISHMILLKDEKQINNTVLKLINSSYSRTN